MTLSVSIHYIIKRLYFMLMYLLKKIILSYLQTKINYKKSNNYKN